MLRNIHKTLYLYFSFNLTQHFQKWSLALHTEGLFDSLHLHSGLHVRSVQFLFFCPILYFYFSWKIKIIVHPFANLLLLGNLVNGYRAQRKGVMELTIRLKVVALWVWIWLLTKVVIFYFFLQQWHSDENNATKIGKAGKLKSIRYIVWVNLYFILLILLFNVAVYRYFYFFSRCSTNNILKLNLLYVYLPY